MQACPHSTRVLRSVPRLVFYTHTLQPRPSGSLTPATAPGPPGLSLPQSCCLHGSVSFWMLGFFPLRLSSPLHFLRALPQFLQVQLATLSSELPWWANYGSHAAFHIWAHYGLGALPECASAEAQGSALRCTTKKWLTEWTHESTVWGFTPLKNSQCWRYPQSTHRVYNWTLHTPGVVETHLCSDLFLSLRQSPPYHSLC